MAAIGDAFEVQVATFGTGWQGICVGIADGWRPASLIDKERVFCLTFEAISPEEFDRDIDELVAQFQQLKVDGRKALAKISMKSA